MDTQATQDSPPTPPRVTDRQATRDSPPIPDPRPLRRQATRDGQLTQVVRAMDIRARRPIRNQARVHLWFEAKFSEPYGPLSCTAEALERFASATFAVGVRLESDDRLHIEAPFGLADLFALRLVPNPYRKTVGFDRASADVRRRWPELL